ncbi:MAG: c-type cytochrome [Pseudohongiellaceae bacterium]
MLKLKRVLLICMAAMAALWVVFAAGTFADQDNQPVLLAQVSDEFDVEATYMASCFACHSTGAAGAPKVGPDSAEAWTPRLEKGFDAVVQSVIDGLNTMPPKGLCLTCNDDELRAVVQYMVDSSTESDADSGAEDGAE